MTNTVDYETLERIDPKEAKAAVERERQERKDACAQAIASVLEEHRCVLDVSVLLSQGQITPQVSVIPQD